MAFPKWIVPAGLAVIVVGLVASTRRPSPKVGDTVAVPLEKVGVTVPPNTPLAGADLAVQLTYATDEELRGVPVGYIDSSGKLQTTGLPAGLPGGVGGFSPKDVTGIWRDGKRVA